MSITIDIDPALEAALRARADAEGLTVEQLAHRLLEREADPLARHHPRLRASLRTIESLRGKLGPVPQGALDAELLYGDH